MQSRIILLQVKGRLGNQMLAYSLLLGSRRVLGFRVFLEEEVLQNLQYYFPLANEVRLRATLLCKILYVEIY